MDKWSSFPVAREARIAIGVSNLSLGSILASSAISRNQQYCATRANLVWLHLSTGRPSRNVAPTDCSDDATQKTNSLLLSSLRVDTNNQQPARARASEKVGAGARELIWAPQLNSRRPNDYARSLSQMHSLRAANRNFIIARWRPPAMMNDQFSHPLFVVMLVVQHNNRPLCARAQTRPGRRLAPAATQTEPETRASKN